MTPNSRSSRRGQRQQRQPRRARAAVLPLLGVFTVFALMALIGLGGCASSFLPKPAQTPGLFTLDDRAPARAVVSRSSAVSAPTLIVNATRAAAGFDTVHIVYVRRAHETAYFAMNQWVDTPSRMLAPVMAQAIERTGAFKAVLSAPTAATGRFRLDTELVRLQHDFTTAPSHVRFTLRAAVIDVGTRRVVAQREFDASVVAASEDPYGGVVAAQAATRQVLLQLAAFCAEATGTAGTAPANVVGRLGVEPSTNGL